MLETGEHRDELGSQVDPLVPANHVADLVQHEMLLVQDTCTVPRKDVIGSGSRNPQSAWGIIDLLRQEVNMYRTAT
jgi:hypothetical protein